jgi:hypothetical protein
MNPAEVSDGLLAEWRASPHPYKVIAGVITEWALTQERGSALPDNDTFAVSLPLVASPATWTRAKNFLVTLGVLSTNDGPYQVA